MLHPATFEADDDKSAKLLHLVQAQNAMIEKLRSMGPPPRPTASPSTTPGPTPSPSSTAESPTPTSVAKPSREPLREEHEGTVHVVL